MGALDIAKKMRDLARQPENREHIVKESSCLPTLVVFLENGDTEVIFTTLEALTYLVQEESNIQAFRDEPNLQDNVRNCMLTHHDAEIRDMAQSVLDNMMNVSADDWNDRHEVDNDKDTHEKDDYSSTNTQYTWTSSGVPLAQRTDNNSTPTKRRAEEFTVFVPTLRSEEDRARLETMLLGTAGVISFCIDMWERKINVRAHLSSNDIVERVESMGITARAVSKTKAAASYEASYLDENEEPQEEQSSGGWLGTLALWGTPAKKTKKAGQSGGGFLGTLTSGWW